MIRIILLTLCIQLLTQSSFAQKDNCENIPACCKCESVGAQIPSSICKRIHEDAVRTCYGSKPNSWLDFYRSPDASVGAKKPLIIWAHANRSCADNNTPKRLWSNSQWDINLKDEDVHLLSWSSVNDVLTKDQLREAEEDFKLVLQWVKENAEALHVNLDSVYVAGQSRGSWVSWKYANLSGKNDDGIKIQGCYMVQAFPKKKGWPIDARDYVTDHSPPLLMIYKNDYDVDDMHSPLNGKEVADKYNDYEMNNVRLKRNVSGDNGDYYKDLIPFLRGKIDFD